MTDSRDNYRPLAPSALPRPDPTDLPPALQLAPWSAPGQQQPRYARQIEVALLHDLATLRH
jgi:hypothetical protein